MRLQQVDKMLQNYNLYLIRLCILCHSTLTPHHSTLTPHHSTFTPHHSTFIPHAPKKVILYVCFGQLASLLLENCTVPLITELSAFLFTQPPSSLTISPSTLLHHTSPFIPHHCLLTPTSPFTLHHCLLTPGTSPFIPHHCLLTFTTLIHPSPLLCSYLTIAPSSPSDNK